MESPEAHQTYHSIGRAVAGFSMVVHSLELNCWTLLDPIGLPAAQALTAGMGAAQLRDSHFSLFQTVPGAQKAPAPEVLRDLRKAVTSTIEDRNHIAHATWRPRSSGTFGPVPWAERLKHTASGVVADGRLSSCVDLDDFAEECWSLGHEIFELGTTFLRCMRDGDPVETAYVKRDGRWRPRDLEVATMP